MSVMVPFLIVMNVVTFAVYGMDKYRARRGKWRTSERTLVLLALFGGSVGALLAMLVFRHKTRHVSFVLGIPAIFLAQLATAVFFLA